MYFWITNYYESLRLNKYTGGECVKFLILMFITLWVQEIHFIVIIFKKDAYLIFKKTNLLLSRIDTSRVKNLLQKSIFFFWRKKIFFCKKLFLEEKRIINSLAEYFLFYNIKMVVLTSQQVNYKRVNF